ncbi:hypothetical protein IIN70_004098 [Escherichia coli]|nr:hypothetical protein [Escherichia coli]
MNNIKNMPLRVSVRLYMLMLKLHELKRKALLVTLTFLTGGLFFVIAGFVMMASKKNNPHITSGRIALIFFIGLCLIGLDQLISRGQKQMNLNPVGV